MSGRPRRPGVAAVVMASAALMLPAVAAQAKKLVKTVTKTRYRYVIRRKGP